MIEYHVTRRHTRIETVSESGDAQTYRLSFEGLPPQVVCRVLTLEAEVPAAWCAVPQVWVDGRPQPAEVVRPRRLRVTVDARDGMEVSFRRSQ